MGDIQQNSLQIHSKNIKVLQWGKPKKLSQTCGDKGDWRLQPMWDPRLDSGAEKNISGKTGAL